MQPEDSRKSSHTADSQTDPAAHPHSPLENWDQPILSFSSISSSSNSSVDLFQVDHIEQHQDAMPPKVEAADHDASANSNHDSSSEGSEADARVHDAGNEAGPVEFFNPRQKPPIQVMDRSENYDPCRIPASVFTPNSSSSPMDWSIASNESLFSIHAGNTSFNRDHFLMMGVDLHKSGELYKPGELHKPGGDMLYKSGELFSLSPSTPTTIAETRGSTDHESDSETPKLGNISTRPTTDANGETRHEEDQNQPPSQPVSTRLSTISSHSDGSGVSGTSAGSFAFPILTEGKRDSTEKAEEPVNHLQKQVSKTSVKQSSICEQLSTKIPSCSLCCCYCTCSCFSWRPRCWSWCC